MEEGGLVPPHSVLAPGTALGLLRSRALPSAQAKGIIGAPKGAFCQIVGGAEEQPERRPRGQHRMGRHEAALCHSGLAPKR